MPHKEISTTARRARRSRRRSTRRRKTRSRSRFSVARRGVRRARQKFEPDDHQPTVSRSAVNQVRGRLREPRATQIGARGRTRDNDRRRRRHARDGLAQGSFARAHEERRPAGEKPVAAQARDEKAVDEVVKHIASQSKEVSAHQIERVATISAATTRSASARDASEGRQDGVDQVEEGPDAA